MSMSTRSRSSIHYFVLSLVACAALLAGCGRGGGGYSPPFVGTLEIDNDPLSSAAVADIEVSETFGSYYAFFPDQNVLPGESWFLDLYPTTYDVTLYWSDFWVDTYTVEIYDQFTTTIFAIR